MEIRLQELVDEALRNFDEEEQIEIAMLLLNGKTDIKARWRITEMASQREDCMIFDLFLQCKDQEAHFVRKEAGTILGWRTTSSAQTMNVSTITGM